MIIDPKLTPEEQDRLLRYVVGAYRDGNAAARAALPESLQPMLKEARLRAIDESVSPSRPPRDEVRTYHELRRARSVHIGEVLRAATVDWKRARQ